MDNRRLLLAVLLSMGVVLLWGVLFPQEPPVQAPAPTETAVPGAVEPTGQREISSGAAEPLDEGAGTMAQADPGSGAAESAPAVEAAGEERIVVDTPDERIELTNRGGQIVSYRLLGQLNDQGEPLDLVRAREGGMYPFGLADSLGRALDLNDRYFQAERSPDGRQVTFRYSGSAGQATKIFRFEDGGLIEVDIEVGGQRDWRVLLGPGIQNPPPVEQNSRFGGRGVIYLNSGDLEREASKSLKAPQAIPTAGLTWVGLEDHYFLTALIPQSPLRQVVMEPVPILEDPEGGPGRMMAIGDGQVAPASDKDNQDLALWVEPGGDRFQARSFWHEKRFEDLEALGVGLERSVDLGFFAFLARPMMIGLQWVHDNIVANYGWAIVVMTFFIKLLMLPLTHRSIVSMRKMQSLNPKMQAIRKQWSGKMKDKQGRPNLEAQRKMNEEIMALYRTEGVNPASGCLPILLQLPVFFAFYKILYAWVELRDAPWLGWVADLSSPDPYYVLPVVMGVTQFIQQWMTPVAGNPMQRRIMLMMPVFFTFLFLSFPSGLVLYWLTNNVLSIGQQKLYNQFRDRQEQQDEEAREQERLAKKAAKKGKKG